MADVVYNVEVRLESAGELAGHFEHADSKAHMLQHTIAKIGEGLSSLADKIEHVTMHFAKWAGGGLLAGATYGVVKLNNELERTKITIGAIFNAQGFANTFGGSMQIAEQQFQQMKQDVKKLPGTLSDLAGIMTMVATPLAQAHASPDTIRKLSGQSMLMGQILGIPPDQVARELGMILYGHAGGRNVLATKLGYSAEERHANTGWSAEKRLEVLQQHYAKYDAAKDEFAKAYVSQWTTLYDNLKFSWGDATKPLFEEVKKSMGEINDYWEKHGDKIKEVIDLVSTRLVQAWDKGLEIVKKYGPFVEHIVESLLRMDPGALAHKVLAGAEGVMEMRMAGGAIGMGARLMGGIGKLGALGGAGGKGAAGALAAMGEALPALGVAAGVLVPLLIAMSGAVDDLADTTSKFHDEAVVATADITDQLGQLAHNLDVEFKPLKDALGIGLIESARLAVAGINDIVAGLGSFWDMASHLTNPVMEDPTGWVWEDNGFEGGGWVYRGPQKPKPGAAPVAPNPNDPMQNGVGTREPKLGAGGGGGGTHIQKVEIVVSSNQDPSRIARVVEARLNELARHPRASRAVPNYSSARIAHG